MKQKRYRSDTVGTMARSHFSRSLRSAAGSVWMRDWPYLQDGVSRLEHRSRQACIEMTYLSVAYWPRSAAWSL